MGLFQLGDFPLSSGGRSPWKIECDALTTDDWAALALMAADLVPPFRSVVGVPRGGVPFANALRKYQTPSPLGCVLVAEDVVTTGRGMEEVLAELKEYDNDPTVTYCGVCVFARGRCPEWVRPLFQMRV